MPAIVNRSEGLGYCAAPGVQYKIDDSCGTQIFAVNLYLERKRTYGYELRGTLHHCN